MNTVTNGCCIIDAFGGIDTASPQISQFTDNFTKIKFVIGKDLSAYTVMILTDLGGQVEFVIPDGTTLQKTVNTSKNETSLLWNIGRTITSQSGIITYQIVAYKGSGDNIESTWYSKEGRLKVCESIDSSTHSAAVVGSHPDLVTKLILEIEKNKEDTRAVAEGKVDKVEGLGLSEESFSAAHRDKLDEIEEGAQKNVCSDWKETDSAKDSYVQNKPSNFGSVLIVNEDATTLEFKGDDIPVAFVQGEGIDFEVNNRPDERSVLISSIIDKEYNPESNYPQSGQAVAQAIAGLIDSAPGALDTLNEISNALNNNPDFGNAVMSELLKKVDISSLSKVATSGSYEDLADKPDLSKVAESGNYDDLKGAPVVNVGNIESNAVFDEEMYCNSGIYCGTISDINDTYYNEPFVLIVKRYYSIVWQTEITPNTNYPIKTRAFNFGDLNTKWDYPRAVYDNKGDVIHETYAPLLSLSKVATSGLYEDLADKPAIPELPELAAVATSGSYNDLTDKPEVKQHYAEGNEQAISGAGVKEALDTLSAVAHSGKYADLSGKPITVLNYYPSNEQLEQMGEGIYLAVVDDYTVPDYLYFFSTREDWENDNGVEYKHQSWTVTIISHSGIRVERKDNYRAFGDGREAYTIDWREVPLNENTATKEYVDSCIGDVETSLENIIEKYGLGGESI